MKRVLCLLICLMLAIPAALADTADSLLKKFNAQLITGGQGFRGKMNITATGIAPWLDAVLPFTAADIQIRAIGEKQGDASKDIADDDDWQIKLYTENTAGQEVGVTWLYGDPEGLYFKSEMLPDTLLTIPVEQVHLLYQIFKGEYADLFFAFDPLSMKEPGANGNAAAYDAVANVLGIPETEWTDTWLPVLEKYLLQLDLWLASYGNPVVQTGDAGTLTMSATYTIPVEDIKKEAKYLIGQMIYDSNLQSLLTPYVSYEQQLTYLNPSMVYFYEACIDALQLEGEVTLSRVLSPLGETVSMNVTLPLPPLPETLTAPVGEAAAALFELNSTNLLGGMNTLSIKQTGEERSVILSGDKRTIELTMTELTGEDESVVCNGSLRIMPNVGVEEEALCAAFTYSSSHRLWQDETYVDHDTTTFSLAVQSDLSMLSDDDPFRSVYVDFAPVGLDLTVDFRNNAYKEATPVQINLDLAVKVPDAEVSIAMVLRTTTKLALEQHSTSGAAVLTAMTDDQKNQLLETLIRNAEQTMATLSQPTAAPTQEAQPTSVPPMTE